MRTTVKTIVTATILLSFYFSSIAQQVAKTIPYSGSPEGLIGFLQFTPSDYGSQKHPLIIFLHGIGERGNGTTQINAVANNAIPKFCAAGASMRFTVNGQTSSFVVLSPQLSTSLGYWPTYYVKQMIAYAKANLSIDPNRIYVCGLSLGGGGIWRLITDTQNFDHTFDGTIAAAAPVCGTQEETDADFCSTIGTNHLPVWAFHCMDDGTVNVGATQHAEILANMCGNFSPAIKFTYYQSGGHGGAWTNAYDTGHITKPVVVNGVVTGFTANPNLYEWFLSNTRGTTTTTNTAPVANAGSAQTVTLPTSTITLSGTGTGTSGATISSYAWVKTSGPSPGSIGSSSAASTTVTGLAQGNYLFTLTVTDNHGLTNSSTVTITVNAAANTAPVANAGSAQTIILPTNTVNLSGTGTGTNGATVSSYAWVKTSGPSSGSIGSSSAASTTVTGLAQGSYVFTLTVTDNHGLTNSSTVTITVNAAANTAPVAIAGSAQTVILPTNTVNLSGTGTGTNGATISSYAWVKTSGPSAGAISSSAAANTAVTGLVQGNYVFTLTVTDNHGLTSTASVTITVNAAVVTSVNKTPSANAGSNQTITLPTNSVTLNGSASSDPDGTITGYWWTQTGGPAGLAMTTRNAVTTTVSGLTAGTYTFVLQVTDNGGLIAFSNITVIVNAAASGSAPAPPVTTINQAPVANAGTAQTVTLPTNTVTLNGSASRDADGTITNYWWTVTSGPAGSVMASRNAATTAVTGLVAGTYTFVLQVTDNGGLLAFSNVTITVNNATTTTGGSLLGYIKISVGPYQACDDASSAGRTAVYGSSIANGTVLYTDAAKKQIFNGGWNWYSFTPTAGGATSYAFAVYPSGGVLLLRNCATGSYMRVAAAATTAEEDIATLNRLKDSAATASSLINTKGNKLAMYPNPVHTTATIQLASEEDGTKTINVYNTSGILKAKYIWQTIKGNNVFTLKDISGLANGLYIIEIRDNNGKPVGSIKFLKM
ncbi:MAG: PKD domain-containing protein [Bacteroidota bacterium]